VGVVGLSVVAWGCSDAQSNAQALFEEGDLAGAEVLYRQLVAADADDIEALNGLAVTLMLVQKYNEALPLQERVIAADPSDVQTRVELGFNYLNHQERSGDAVRVLSEAVAIDGSAKNLTFLAQAQAVAGQMDKAEQSLRRAVEVDPEYAYSYSRLVRLLEDEGRTEEAQQVAAEASQLGIVIEDSN
jgi:tetratricopeptide (TPR) repeat protein